MDGEDESAVFCDSSVLLAYVFEQNIQSVRELLLESDRSKVISQNVQSEINSVSDRKDQIDLDFIELITSDEETVTDATVESREYLKPNDEQFFRTLRDQIAEEETETAKLGTLREKQKIVDRRLGQIEGLIERICSQNDDMMLLFALNSVVENKDDCEVLADAALWSRDGGSGNLATRDRNDMLNNDEVINDKISDSYGTEGTLTIGLPSRFLE